MRTRQCRPAVSEIADAHPRTVCHPSPLVTFFKETVGKEEGYVQLLQYIGKGVGAIYILLYKSPLSDGNHPDCSQTHLRDAGELLAEVCQSGSPCRTDKASKLCDRCQLPSIVVLLIRDCGTRVVFRDRMGRKCRRRIGVRRAQGFA